MIERLELSAWRLAQIPGETLVPEPFRDYFARTADFLLAAMKNENTPALWHDILPGEYGRSYANPAFAAARLGLEMGRILSAVCAELRAVIPCAAAGDEEGMASLLELFLEIYGDFTGEELPRPGDIRTIFRYYAEDYLPDLAAEEAAGRLCPGRPQMSLPQADSEWEEGWYTATGRTFREMLESSDLTDPSYLYGLGRWVSEESLLLAARLGAMRCEEADRMARECLAPILRKVSDLPRVKTIGLTAPSGAERILLMAVKRLERDGYAVTLPRPAVRLCLKNDCISPESASEILAAHEGQRLKNDFISPERAPNPAFLRDHREDLALFMDENFVSRRKRAAREAYEAFRAEAEVFGGVHFLEIPGADKGEGRAHETDMAACPEAISMSPAQARLARSLARSLEEIRMRYENV